MGVRSADYSDRVSSRSADWKDHYSCMERESESVISRARRESGLPDPDSKEYIAPIVAQTLKQNSKLEELHKDGIISKRDARTLLMVREMIESHLKREEQRRKSNIITVVNPNNFQISPNSIESYIARVLDGQDTGLHITEILTRIEQLGWRTTSVYHKYSEIYSAIRKHYYMFEKVGKAKFRLRGAFAHRPMDPPHSQPARPSFSKGKITTLKDVAALVLKQFYNPPGLYPSLVWAIMLRMGYDCHYSSVYRAMQDEKKFTRNGFFYSVAGANAEKVSAKKSKRS